MTLSTPCPNSMQFASQISDPDQIIFRLHLRFPSLYSKPPWSLSSQIAGQITKPPNGPIHFLDTFAAQSLLRNNSRTMTQWLPQIMVISLGQSFFPTHLFATVDARSPRPGAAQKARARSHMSARAVELASARGAATATAMRPLHRVT